MKTKTQSHVAQSLLMYSKVLIVVLLTTMIYACNQDADLIEQMEEPTLQFSHREDARIVFSKALAKAVKEEDVRNFIKIEALKKFDNDYDVLFSMVKDKEINKEYSFEEYLNKFLPETWTVEKISMELPLLTILVPELIHFSASNWEVSNQIPLVAAVPNNLSKESEIKGFDHNGNEFLLKKQVRPDVPVIVVKDNERIIANAHKELAGGRQLSISDEVFFTSTLNDYFFSDQAFNNMPKNNSNGRTVGPYNPNYIYRSVVEAYDNNATYHRDYVYYGILPPPTSGTFRSNYAEFITAFRIESVLSVNYIYDDYYSDWTDGALEFFVNIYFIDDKTQLKSLVKGFSATVNDLFEVNSNNVVTGTKQYNIPPIEILPWDLKKYGDTWKFVISEYDAANNSITYNTSLSSTFGSNFSNNSKDGPGFGGSSSATFSQSISFQMTSSTDQLGEGVLSFFDPVIINKTWFFFPPPLPIYETYDVTTGFVRLSVEPRKRF